MKTFRTSSRHKPVTTKDVIDKLVLQRLRNNENWIALLCGGPGSGKSYTALRIGEMVQPGFSADQVVFNLGEFLEVLDTLSKKDMLIFDEAEMFSARRAMSTENVETSIVLSMYRYRQIPTIFTVPEKGQIDINAKRLMNSYLYTIRVNRQDPGEIHKNESGVRWYQPYVRPISYKGEDIIFPHPWVRGSKVDKVWFRSPDPTLLEEYEKKKDSSYRAKKDEALANVKRKRQAKGRSTGTSAISSQVKNLIETESRNPHSPEEVRSSIDKIFQNW